MSHKRQDTFVPDGEWRQHLRPDGKRSYHKAERRHAKNFQETEEEIVDPGSPPEKKKKKKIKKYGVKTFYKNEEDNPPSQMFRNDDGWTTWYKTEKARDQSYDKIKQDLERINKCKEQNILNQYKQIGCIYVFGDTVEKIER
jgi:hypothetical protein